MTSSSSTWDRPADGEAGFACPAVVDTAQRVLSGDPTVVHIVPITTTLRGFHGLRGQLREVVAVLLDLAG